MKLSLTDLTKDFGSLRAVDHVSLDLDGGTLYGLLGRNGAGKTTLLNLIAGRLIPTQGACLLDGAPVLEQDEALGKICCIPDTDFYPESMRVKTAIRLGKLGYPQFDPERALGLCKRFQLNPNAKIHKLSTGYQCIFRDVMALASGAPILLLDEPVLGLDAWHRELFYQLAIETMERDHPLLLLSTHLIAEVAPLLEQVILLHEGKVLLQEPAESLQGRGVTVSGVAQKVDAFCAGRQVIGVDTLGGLKSAHLLLEEPVQFPEDLTVTPLDLQSLFVHLTRPKEDDHA